MPRRESPTDLHTAWVSDRRDGGCSWINLHFAIETNGTATVRYEGPDGEPLPNGGIPACSGGFDCHRLMPYDGFMRFHMRLRHPEM